jgi:ABC-type phosphate/phosphonate transport system substrate-binding protein
VSAAIASLPMYDAEAVRPLVDLWWQGLADAFVAQGLRDVPPALDRARSRESAWCNPRLLLSQTCGYPFMQRHREHLQLVMTPCYRAPGCHGACYVSLVLVREEDPVTRLGELAGARFAVNALDSWSGWCTLRREVLRLGGDPEAFLAHRELAGAHRDSAAAVCAGRCRACAVDAVTYSLLQRHEPATVRGLRILQHTAAAPGLPYVTARGTPTEVVAALRRGLRAAVTDPRLASVRAALGIIGMRHLEERDYAPMLAME